MNVSLDLVRELFRHMEWADAELWRAMRAKPESLGDPKLLKLVRHIHAVEHAFLRLWRGEDMMEGFTAERAPDELQQFARAFYAGAYEFLASFDAARSAEILEMPFLPELETYLGRPVSRPTYAETLLQLPMHGTYHRGQANLRLREAGGEPPLVDYIAWVWYGRPEPAWP